MNPEKQATTKKMIQEIHELMEANLDKWKKVDAIRETYDDFVKNIKDLNDLEAHLSLNTDPLKKSRDTKKNKLSSALFPINNILFIYLKDQKDGKASSKLITSEDKLNGLSRSRLMKQAGEVQKHIKKVQDASGQLENYGLTSAMIKKFETAFADYEKALKEYNERVNVQKKAVRKSEKLLRSNMRILKKRMDQLMTAFSVQSPAFYKKYQSVRQGAKAQ